MDAWENGAFRVYLSWPIFDELREVLEKPYFRRRVPPDALASYLHRVQSMATIVPLTIQVRDEVAADPDDDMLFSTALSAGVTIVVTRDAAVRDVDQYRGVHVLTPAELLAAVDQQ